METKFKIKQLIVNKVKKTRLIKVINVPQEPIEVILNSIYKIEIEEVFLKEAKLGIDSKVSLHILYIPQGIGEFEQTFSVSFNFFHELNLELNQEINSEEKGVNIWPQVIANIEKLVIKPQGKSLLVLMDIATEVIVMGIMENSISENIIDIIKDNSLKSLAPIVLEEVKLSEEITIHKELVLTSEAYCPWLLAEVYLEGINYSYVINETGLEIKSMLLARIVGFKKSNPRLQSYYQFLEFSTEKTIEGWESQGGLVIEPHFYQLGVNRINDLMYISCNIKVTLIRTMTKHLKFLPQDLIVNTKPLVIEKPRLRQREVIELEREIRIDSWDIELRPEVFIRLAQRDLNVLEGLICLKICSKKYPRNTSEGQVIKAIEYIPFKLESTFVKEPNLHTLAKARVKIKKMEQVSNQKIKCCLLVSIDLLGSEIINS